MANTPSWLNTPAGSLGYAQVDPSGWVTQYNGGPTGQGENWDGTYNPATEYYNYQSGKQEIGDPFQATNLATGKKDTRAFQDDAPSSDWMIPLTAVVGGLAMGGALGAAGGAGGAGSAGAAAGPGSAGWGMGLDSMGVGSGSMGIGGGSTGLASGLAGSGAGAWTSAAADSQLANAAMGDSALGGYSSAGLGGVTGSPVSGGISSGLGSTGSSGLSSILQKLGGSAVSSLLGGGNGGSSGSGFNLGGLGQLGAGIWDMNNQNKASSDMLSYLKQRQSMNDNMYSPGSPEYEQMKAEMERKDAAAGRNSQYGPRSVDLAAKIAGLKMDANTRMTMGTGNFMANALNQRASSNAGVTSALGSLFAPGANGIANTSLTALTNYLKNFGTSSPITGLDINAPGGTNFGSDIGYDDPMGW